MAPNFGWWTTNTAMPPLATVMVTVNADGSPPTTTTICDSERLSSFAVGGTRRWPGTSLYGGPNGARFDGDCKLVVGSWYPSADSPVQTYFTNNAVSFYIRRGTTASYPRFTQSPQVYTDPFNEAITYTGEDGQIRTRTVLLPYLANYFTDPAAKSLIAECTNTSMLTVPNTLTAMNYLTSTIRAVPVQQTLTSLSPGPNDTPGKTPRASESAQPLPSPAPALPAITSINAPEPESVPSIATGVGIPTTPIRQSSSETTSILDTSQARDHFVSKPLSNPSPMRALVIGTQTFIAGAPGDVIAGQTLSVPSSGNEVILGSATVALSDLPTVLPQQPGLQSPREVISFTTLSTGSALYHSPALVIGTQTLLPGSSITVNGKSVALPMTAAGQSQQGFRDALASIVVDGTTIPVAQLTNALTGVSVQSISLSGVVNQVTGSPTDGGIGNYIASGIMGVMSRQTSQANATQNVVGFTGSSAKNVVPTTSLIWLPIIFMLIFGT
ncbi:Hypothetical protein D9617_5g070140 [Elsinoe fawcettii]|nr:Hypothetical protein D9617_5g070140 [Elsinoe fawcettii]